MAEKTGWVLLEKQEGPQTTAITTGMQVPTGTLVRTYTVQMDPHNNYHTSEALVFVPGVMLKENKDKSWEILFG